MSTIGEGRVHAMPNRGGDDKICEHHTIMGGVFSAEMFVYMTPKILFLILCVL